MAAALDEIDGMDVVCVDDPGAAQSAHDLRENVRGHLAPREVPPERRHRERYRGVNVALGDPSGDPRPQCEADGPSEVEG